MIILMTMEILRVTPLLLLFCFYSIFCFPSRPLNERSAELAWQAWLLVDDQNQNKHYDPDSFTRRRITPKSVFIAPTFSPESLPACADGYRPDSMGRCIKIIKLDEEAHLDFLLEKLNAQFGNYDDIEDDSQDDVPTTGPFQLNIPLAGASEEDTKDRLHGNLDIAIVVAPTNGNFGLEDSVKTNVKKTVFGQNTEMSSPHKPSADQPFNSNNDNNNSINNKRKTENVFPITEQAEATTVVAVDTTTLSDLETTSTEAETEGTSIFPTSQTVPIETTTPEIETKTTIGDQHALFFLQPALSNTKHVQNGINTAEDTPIITSSHDSVVASNHSLTTLLSNSTVVDDTLHNLNSKQPTAAVLNSEQGHSTHPESSEVHTLNSEDLMASENVHRQTEFVRFPSAEEEASPHDYVKDFGMISPYQSLPYKNTNLVYASQYQHNLGSGANSGHTQNSELHNAHKTQSTEQFGTLFDEYLNSRGADLKGNERFVFKNRDTVSAESLPSSNLDSDVKNGGGHKVQSNLGQLHASGGYEVSSERVFNHRNRDKNSNLWSLPSSWIESSPQKPIVLRFSPRSSSSRHLLEEHLLPHTQNSHAFYREVPTEDFSYIFGVKQNHNRRRNR